MENELKVVEYIRPNGDKHFHVWKAQSAVEQAQFHRLNDIGAEVSLEFCRTFWNLEVIVYSHEDEEDVVLEQHIGHYPDKEAALKFLRGIVNSMNVPEAANIGK